MKLFYRIFPHPLLTLVLVIMWVLMQNKLSAAHFVLAIILGVLIPKITSKFWPERPVIKAYRKVFKLGVLVFWDILVANIAVAKIVLFVPNKKIRSHFVSIPLDIKSPEGKSTFAGIITLTPGTVSSDFSKDGESLLVHCLDTPDINESIRSMKERYESRLMEIFP